MKITTKRGLSSVGMNNKINSASGENRVYDYRFVSRKTAKIGLTTAGL